MLVSSEKTEHCVYISAPMLFSILMFTFYILSQF